MAEPPQELVWGAVEGPTCQLGLLGMKSAGLSCPSRDMPPWVLY